MKKILILFLFHYCIFAHSQTNALLEFDITIGNPEIYKPLNDTILKGLQNGRFQPFYKGKGVYYEAASSSMPLTVILNFGGLLELTYAETSKFLIQKGEIAATTLGLSVNEKDSCRIIEKDMLQVNQYRCLVYWNTAINEGMFLIISPLCKVKYNTQIKTIPAPGVLLPVLRQNINSSLYDSLINHIENGMMKQINAKWKGNKSVPNTTVRIMDTKPCTELAGISLSHLCDIVMQAGVMQTLVQYWNDSLRRLSFTEFRNDFTQNSPDPHYQIQSILIKEKWEFSNKKSNDSISFSKELLEYYFPGLSQRKDYQLELVQAKKDIVSIGMLNNKNKIVWFSYDEIKNMFDTNDRWTKRLNAKERLSIYNLYFQSDLYKLLNAQFFGW